MNRIKLACTVCKVETLRDPTTWAIWRNLRYAGFLVTSNGKTLEIRPGSKIPKNMICKIRRHKSRMMDLLAHPMYEHSDGLYLCGSCLELAV
jgi:hypothetical protein